MIAFVLAERLAGRLAVPVKVLAENRFIGWLPLTTFVVFLTPSPLLHDQRPRSHREKDYFPMATGTLRGDGLVRAHTALAALEEDPQRLDRARMRFSDSPPPYIPPINHTTQLDLRVLILLARNSDAMRSVDRS